MNSVGIVWIEKTRPLKSHVLLYILKMQNCHEEDVHQIIVDVHKWLYEKLLSRAVAGGVLEGTLRRCRAIVIP